MKKIFRKFTLLLLLVPMLNSCNMDPLSYSDINPSIFPQTEEDLQAMVLSCYYPLRGSWWDGINTTSERGQMFANDACTEILAGKYSIQKYCHEMSYNTETSDLTYFYYTREEPYGFIGKISRCTTVIDMIEKSDLPRESKDRYIAEVRCARGYLSYILYDMFGPLVIAPIEVLDEPLNENPLPRLSREAMVEFIEDDLKFAAEYLPYPKETEYGKFSKGLANMLLIRLYLHETPIDKAYYNEVERIAREMMTADYGYAMVDDYPSLFELDGQSKCTSEYIYIVPCAVDGPSQNQWHLMALPPDIANVPLAGWATVQSTWLFYDSFEENDTRKTYLLPEYTALNNGVEELRNRENPDQYLDLGPIPLKYEYDPAIAGSGGYSDLDIVVYRYPDVLLSLAEAIVMKPGGSVTQEAVDLMNDVRERAKIEPKNLSDFPTKEAFIDQLLLERAHEFWCESGQYRADLIRFDKLYDRVLEMNAGQAPYASKDKYVYPLPPEVIVDGKGQVIQNPGYTI